MLHISLRYIISLNMVIGGKPPEKQHWTYIKIHAKAWCGFRSKMVLFTMICSHIKPMIVFVEIYNLNSQHWFKRYA